MKRKDLVAVADAIAVVRPDWQQPGIIAALQTCAHTWPGTDGALVAHAINIAARPDAQTPAAINVLPSIQARPATLEPKEPTCYICALTRSQCRALHDFEVAHGLPDPHIFETSDEALANRSVHQLGDLIAGMDELRAARAKDRAGRASAEIRPMIATNGDKARLSRPDDQPRKCTGCGGTLASNYSEPTHPGCTDEPEQETA